MLHVEQGGAPGLQGTDAGADGHRVHELFRSVWGPKRYCAGLMEKRGKHRAHAELEERSG